jgi:hypothetical protein
VTALEHEERLVSIVANAIGFEMLRHDGRDVYIGADGVDQIDVTADETTHCRAAARRAIIHLAVAAAAGSATPTRGEDNADEIVELRAALATRADLAREAERWRDGPPGDAEPGSEVYDLWLLVGKFAVVAGSATPTHEEE